MAAVLGISGTALAANPQFKSATASVGSSGELNVAVQVVGLGSGESVGFTMAAKADVTWGCVNKALKAPKAENKRSASYDVSASGSLPAADKNGSLKATVSAPLPDAPTTLSCPTKMSVVVVAVAYKNISVTVTGSVSGLTQNPADVSRIFYQ